VASSFTKIGQLVFMFVCFFVCLLLNQDTDRQMYTRSLIMITRIKPLIRMDIRYLYSVVLFAS
jgi:hypothetical protein